MNKVYSIIIFTVIGSNLLMSQNSDMVLLGEGNSDKVKLFWLPKEIPDNFEGFNVKRRSIIKDKTTDWQILNETLIIPENTLSKSLGNVTNSQIELVRLENKRIDIIQGNLAIQSNEINSENYLNILNDSSQLVLLSLLFALDYDIALMHGFGYEDFNVPKAKEYEYGVFMKTKNSDTDRLVQSYIWEYGTSPEYKLDLKPEFKANRRKTRVQVKWEVDVKQFQQDRRLHGFNVYRKEGEKDYIQLNDKRILVNSSEDTTYLVYNDRNLKKDIIYTYAAVPVSIFNTESEKYVIEFNPMELPDSIYNPLLIAPASVRNPSENPVMLKWEFPPEQDKFIAGFKIEKKFDVNTDFEEVARVSPQTREYPDQNPGEPENDLFYYRVSAIVEGSFDLQSKTEMVKFYPYDYIYTPTNLRGEIDPDNISIINLTWDAVDHPIFSEYKIYTDLGEYENLGWEANITNLTANSYSYEVVKTTGKEYRFAISAMDTENYESELSNIVTVVVPSKVLPILNVWPVSQEDKQVTLNWEYPDNLPDLAGFRLYQNDILIADENVLNENARTWTSNELEVGQYSYTIQAVTQYGVVSKLSIARLFRIRE